MKKKMSLNDLLKIGTYYAFSHLSVDGVRGTLYKMSNLLNAEKKDMVLSFKNTRLLIAQSQFAPEMASVAVFIGY